MMRSTPSRGLMAAVVVLLAALSVLMSSATSASAAESSILNGTTLQTEANFNIQSASPTSVGAAVRGASGQTANIFSVESALGGSLFAVTPNHEVGINTASPKFPLDVNGSINTANALYVKGSPVCFAGGCIPLAGAGDYIQNNTSGTSEVGNIDIESFSTGLPAEVIRVPVGQSSNVFEVRTLAGTTEASISPFGGLTLSPTLNSTQAFEVQNATGSSQLRVDTTNGATEVKSHIKTANASGTTTVKVESAAGSGAMASLSGNDTAGKVTITTGSAPTTGELVTVTFGSACKTAPYVNITPNSSSAAVSKYYVTNVTNSGFVIAVTAKPKAKVSYEFSYEAVE